MPPTFVSRNRRPSRITHRANLEADFYRKKTPVMAPDGDTFYYDQAFIAEWTMPADLWIRLPVQLTTELKAWQAAGAAVLTVLARYDKLEQEAPVRGWPEKMNTHLSRTTSHASPIPQSPMSPLLKSPQHGDLNNLPPMKSGFRARKDSSMPAIIDTPPFTPQDSGLSDQAIYDALSATSSYNETDLYRVNSRLATLGSRDSEHEIADMSPVATPISRRSSTMSQTAVQPMFDEAAWDVYINSCKAELVQLRTETLVRFRHLGRAIDRLWNDLKHDKARPMLMSASIEFVSWWRDMAEKAQQCEEEAKALELPDLEEVRLERIADGLPI